MNIKHEQIPLEIIDIAVEVYDAYSGGDEIASHYAMQQAFVAAVSALLGDPRAWVVVAHGKDQWATTRHDKALEYGAGDHPDEGHLVALYALPTDNKKESGT